MKNSWLRRCAVLAGVAFILETGFAKPGKGDPPPQPPAITSPSSASGVTGSPFNYQITATNSPTSFSASPLPAGLSVNTATGLISGTPTAAGTTDVLLSATNADGTGTAHLSLVISGPTAPPVITSANQATGGVNQPFNFQITATNGPTSFGAAPLPPGLAVNPATGLISGTPTAPGSTAVNVSASNAGGTGSAVLTINIAVIDPGPPPVINSAPSAAGQVGAAFQYQITATNGPTRFGAAPLPAGLGVNAATGLISGVPAIAGTFPVTVSAANLGGTGTAAVALTIAPATPPGTPTLTGTAQSDSAIQWTWPPVANATTYQLLDSTGRPVSGPLAGNTVAFTERGLTPNTAYSRQLVAGNGVSQTNSALVTRFTQARPPANLRLISVSVSSVTLSWAAGGNPANTKYRILAQAGQQTPLRQDVTASPGSLGPLAPGTTYFVQVLAVNGDGLPSAAGTAASGGQGFFVITPGAAAGTSVSNAKAFPNPFRPSQGDTEVQFTQLPPGAHLQIFTILGERVQELDADGTGEAHWDGRNAHGQSAASGVYFVVAKANGDKRVMKVAVQR